MDVVLNPEDVRVQAELGDCPIWWRGLGSDGSPLGLSADLIHGLLTWNRRYETWATSPDRPDASEIIDFRLTGLRLAAQVQEHLGARYRVSYRQVL